MLSDKMIRSIIQLRRLVPENKRSEIRLSNPNLMKILLTYYNSDCPKKTKLLIRNIFEKANDDFDRSGSAMSNIANNYFNELANTTARSVTA